MKTPADPAEAPLWDLSDLYASHEDPRIEADLERARALVGELNALQGRLLEARSSADLLGALGAYAFLAASTDRNSAAAQGFEATLR